MINRRRNEPQCKVMQLATTLQDNMAEKEKLRMMRNVLLSTGHKAEAEKLVNDMVKRDAIVDATIDEVDRLQMLNRNRMFKMFFSMDLCYSQVITAIEVSKKVAGIDAGLLKCLDDQYKSLHSSIRGIDDYNIARLSQEYCDATCELDDVYNEQISGMLDAVWLNVDLKQSYEFDECPETFRREMFKLVFLLRTAQKYVRAWQDGWNDLVEYDARLADDYDAALAEFEKVVEKHTTYGINQLLSEYDKYSGELAKIADLIAGSMARTYSKYGEILAKSYYGDLRRKEQQESYKNAKRKNVMRKIDLLTSKRK